MNQKQVSTNVARSAGHADTNQDSTGFEAKQKSSVDESKAGKGVPASTNQAMEANPNCTPNKENDKRVDVREANLLSNDFAIGRDQFDKECRLPMPHAGLSDAGLPPHRDEATNEVPQESDLQSVVPRFSSHASPIVSLTMTSLQFHLHSFAHTGHERKILTVPTELLVFGRGSFNLL